MYGNGVKIFMAIILPKAKTTLLVLLTEVILLLEEVVSALMQNLVVYHIVPFGVKVLHSVI